MKKLLLILSLVLFAGELMAQAVDPPAGYTANHRFRKYNEGDHPSADSLNNDKDSIDAKLRRPGWTQQDSLQLHKSNKTITLIPPTLKATYGITFPDSLPTGAEFLWMMNATGTLSYIDRDSLGSASAAASDGSASDTLWIPIWNSANDTLPNASVTEAEFYSSGTTRTKAYTYFRKDSLTTRLRFWGTDALVGAGTGTAKLYVNDSLLISRAFSADGDFNNAVSISHITNGTVATVKVEVVLGGGNNHAFKRAAIEVARAVVTANSGEIDSTSSGFSNPLYNAEWFEDFYGNPTAPSTSTSTYKDWLIQSTGATTYATSDSTGFGNAIGTVSFRANASNIVGRIHPYAGSTSRGSFRLNVGTFAFKIRFIRFINGTDNDSLRIGMVSVDNMAATLAITAPTSGIYFEHFENSGDSLYAVVKTADTTARVNTGVATGVGWRTVEASTVGGVTTFKVDGVVTNTITVATSNTLHNPLVFDKVPSVQSGFYLDYIWIRQSGIDRRW